MADRSERGIVRRIVTAVPAAAEVAPLLRLAARTAGHCDAIVAAVLVHNEALMRLASLPVTRHLLAATGSAEPLTAQTLRLAMAASGQQLRRELDAIMGAASVRWTLHTAADPEDATPPVQIQSEDLLLITAEARIDAWFPSAQPEPAVIAVAIGPISDGPDDVVTVHDGSDAGWRALEAALLLARAQDSCCHVVVPEDVPAQTRRRLDSQVADAGVPCHTIVAAGLDVADIVARIRASHAGIAVLPAHLLAQPGLAAGLRRLSVEAHLPKPKTGA